MGSLFGGGNNLTRALKAFTVISLGIRVFFHVFEVLIPKRWFFILLPTHASGCQWVGVWVELKCHFGQTFRLAKN